MRHDGARDLLATAIERRADIARGAPNGMFRMLSSRTLDQTVADVSQLPVVPGAEELQDPTGLLCYFMLGYSAIGGPDPLR